MATKIDRLLAAKQKIEKQIAQEELAAKNKNRTERLTLRLMNKYPDLFLCDPAILEKSLDSAFSSIAASLKK